MKSKDEQFEQMFLKMSIKQRADFVKGALDYLINHQEPNEGSMVLPFRNSGRMFGRIIVEKSKTDPRVKVKDAVKMFKLALKKIGETYK